MRTHDNLLQPDDRNSFVDAATRNGVLGFHGDMDETTAADLVRDLLAAPDRHRDEEMASLIAGNPDYLPDEVSARLLGDVGISPLAACAMSLLHANGLYIGDPFGGASMTRRTLVGNGNLPIDMVNFADGTIQWLCVRGDTTFGREDGITIEGPSGYFNLPPLPETVLTGLAGEPLARLLSHPVLDPLGLEIALALSVEAPFGNSRSSNIQVRTRILDIEELVRIPVKFRA